MYGWRARLGLILPADNAVAEPEFYSLGLRGISYHAARLRATDHEEMRSQASAAASSLREMGVDVLVYACAETSFDAGDDNREHLIETLRRESGVPVVTATTAMLEAVAVLGWKRLAVVTPYTDHSGELLEETLRGQHLEVTAARHRDFSVCSSDPREWYETNRQPSSTAYSMVREVDSEAADGVLIAATNFPTLEMLQQAEDDLGKPVVSCNQSILWWCLRELGIQQPISGYGALLRGAS